MKRMIIEADVFGYKNIYSKDGSFQRRRTIERDYNEVFNLEHDALFLDAVYLKAKEDDIVNKLSYLNKKANTEIDGIILNIHYFEIDGVRYMIGLNVPELKKTEGESA